MRSRKPSPVEYTADRLLLYAAVAAAACAQPGRGFPGLDDVADVIRTAIAKHGFNDVKVASTTHDANTELIVYLVAEDSTSDRIALEVPYDERRFLTCEVSADGGIETGNGIVY